MNLYIVVEVFFSSFPPLARKQIVLLHSTFGGFIFERTSLESFPATDENLVSTSLFIIYTESDSALLVGPLCISPGFATANGASRRTHRHRL